MARNPDYLSVGDAGPDPLSVMVSRHTGIAAAETQELLRALRTPPSTTDRGMQPQMRNMNTEPVLRC
jgi:hypothetical protein